MARAQAMLDTIYDKQWPSWSRRCHLGSRDRDTRQQFCGVPNDSGRSQADGRRKSRTGNAERRLLIRDCPRYGVLMDEKRMALCRASQVDLSP